MSKQELKNQAADLIRQRASLKKQLADVEMNLDLLAISTIRGDKKEVATFRVVPKKKKAKLNSTEKKVVKMLKEGKMTQTAIAEKMGIHQSQVSVIKKKAGLKMLSRAEVVDKMQKSNGSTKKSKKVAKKDTTKTPKIDGPLTHFTLTVVKVSLLTQPDKEHNFESMFKKFIGSDYEKSLRANFSKIVAYATSEGSILRTKTRPLTIRKRNIKKIRSLDAKGFNAFCSSTKRSKN